MVVGIILMLYYIIKLHIVYHVAAGGHTMYHHHMPSKFLSHSKFVYYNCIMYLKEICVLCVSQSYDLFI